MTDTSTATSPTTRPAVAGAPRGLFIAVEGGEGSGKTTQIAALRQSLETHLGTPVVCTREPGGTPLGLDIRDLVLRPREEQIDPRAEALLFAADRAQHAREIRESLGEGVTVVTDRYIDSSVAYQGGARGLAPQEIRDLSAWATGNLIPDLTVVLDIDPRIGLLRARADEFGTADRLEAEPLAFHDKVRATYLEAAAANPTRYAVVDASGTPEEVAAAVEQVVIRLAKGR